MLLACLASTAHASDFWDEVRAPGLRAYRTALREAEDALARGRASDALEHARQALGRLDARPEAHRMAGRALSDMRRHDQAVEAFERALALDPAALDPPAAATAAATSAIATGALPLEERILRRALGHLSDEPRGALLVWHGDVLQALGAEHLLGAMLSYREALRSEDADHPRALLGLALALHRDGEVDQAEALARQIAEADALERAMARVSPLPLVERVARRALRLDAIGDHAGALAAWRTVAKHAGPWRAHAERAGRAARAHGPAAVPR